MLPKTLVNKKNNLPFVCSKQENNILDLDKIQILSTEVTLEGNL